MKRTVLALGALLVCVTTTSVPARGGTAVLPPTIPAVREWHPGGVGYTFTSSSKVVAAESALAGPARLLAEDLAKVLNRPVGHVTGGPAAPGDIELRPGTASGGPEGYVLQIGQVLGVEGAVAGVRLGTRSVVQLLRQQSRLPGGQVRDWPTYQERGFMVDLGRKYLSLDWLRTQIREMAYLKLNYLHLHLSDEHGFRLESATHPEITAEQHYSKAEIRELIAYAGQYGIQVVPELDFPGHMQTILAAHPELKLVAANGQVQHGNIDLSQPAAYDLMRDLITEFLPLFPSRYWHIGADEYVQNFAEYPQLERYAKQRYGPAATGPDAYLGFVNWADEIVRTAGKTTRMWNDGLTRTGGTLTVNPAVVVEHWSMSGPTPWVGPAWRPAELVAAGHKVMNASITPTYYTVGGLGALLNTAPAIMYDTWDPGLFVDGSRLPVADNLGAKLHLWCDQPDRQNEQQLAAEVYPRLRVMAQHTWRSPTPPLYTQFAGRISAVGAAPKS
ncbi:glycoside hydrolase [Kribbella antibiotica]|uniref:Glycoside hydrolase n=1 Tax=Kribbella antibiotica TaxID=190195 RepID=A0A4V2YQA3_9ACTN|nr:glycoside hydrolase family 20 protein [Kribbella antibiotica]TDD61297.1 glycoside hydrolase [Kribbella antibiotica]